MRACTVLRWCWLLSLCVLLVSGCGGANYEMPAANPGLLVHASLPAVATNGQVEFTATLPGGEPASVQWFIAGGDNAAVLGQGHIDASGLYVPPNAVSQDNVPIQIRAQLASDPSISAGYTITVHPGFVQPLLPEDATLSGGSSVEVAGQIAEVNAGNVVWALAVSPYGQGSTAAGPLGALTGESCRRAPQQYTTCRVTYTAPAHVIADTIYVIGAVNGTQVTSPLKVLLSSRGVNSSPTLNQAMQTGPAALGTSGGNDNDFDTYEGQSDRPYVADCCGGTLGALVEDGRHEDYILGNNHVLAESDQAAVGDTIDQPGLMDAACMPLSRGGTALHPVGTLRFYVPLASRQTNVDAALASVAPGAIDLSGSILQLGRTGPENTLEAAPPLAGKGEKLTAANLVMQVAKSGRTTGLTCSTIESIALTIKVDYYKDCAETQPYVTKLFHDQIGIAGDRFSDSGDSGALIVDAANAAPLALYFAGGTDGDGTGLSVANPIGDVLSELGEQAGADLRIAGTETPHKVACMQYDSAPERTREIAPTALARAQKAAAAAAPLMTPGSGMLGFAAGNSLDSIGDPAVVVYVENSHAADAVPQIIGGMRTQVIVTDAAAIDRGNAPHQLAIEAGLHLSETALANAVAVQRRAAAVMMKDPAVFGVGVTQSRDNPAEAALLVLVDMRQPTRPMPAIVGGLRVRYLRLQRFHVTRSRFASSGHAGECALRKTLRPEEWKAR